MFPEFQSVLRLDQVPLTGQFVNICEEDDQLGLFAIHHFLHLAIKDGKKILLIGLENSFGHFNGVALKFGFNLVKLRESGELAFFDGLKSISQHCANDSGQFQSCAFENGLKDFIDKNIAPGSFVIIDKISLLNQLGLKVPQVVKLMNGIILTTRSQNCCLVTRSRAISRLDNDEDDLEEPADHLCAFLTQVAALNIQLRPLMTGKSATVTGNISFLWTSDSQLCRYQYRLEEKDVKVFAKGTSAGVL